MAWIESHQELRNHPKLRRLALLLDVSRAAALGHLHLLWWWALDHAEDGDLSEYDEVDLALAAEWEGDPDALLGALIRCGPGGRAGFVERCGDGLVLHDWNDYAAPIRARRDAGRKANHDRWHTGRGQVVDGCRWCATDPIGLPSGSDRTPPSIRPDSTKPDLTKPSPRARAHAREPVDNVVDSKPPREPVFGSAEWDDRQRERERRASSVEGGR